ncbi:MAG: NAD(P)H-dependent oxidoreductase, partial [Ottowia sp.]|nr:NAD(P)H-dependent oxidoreductase [Ottowia sp.]
MNTLIVINHPYENSFCRAILEAAKTGAAQRGSVDVIDLDADGFNPV